MVRWRLYCGGVTRACLLTGLLICNVQHVAAQEKAGRAPLAASAFPAQPLAPSTSYTLRFVQAVPCAPKRRPLSVVHHHVRRPVRMTPVRAYTPPVRYRPLSDLLHKARPTRCEVERRTPFMTPAIADASPVPVLSVSLPVTPTGAISSLPQPTFQVARAEGTGPAPFAYLPPITGARESRLTRTPNGVVSPAPEAPVWLLMVSGVALVGAALRRRRVGEAAVQAG